MHLIETNENALSVLTDASFLQIHQTGNGCRAGRRQPLDGIGPRMHHGSSGVFPPRYYRSG